MQENSPRPITLLILRLDTLRCARQLLTTCWVHYTENFSQNISQDQFFLLLLSWLSTSCLQSNILIPIDILKPHRYTSWRQQPIIEISFISFKAFYPPRAYQYSITYWLLLMVLIHIDMAEQKVRTLSNKQFLCFFLMYVWFFFSFCHGEDNRLKPTFQTSVKSMTQFISNYDFVR